MKYYKNTDGQVYAFEADGSQDKFIKPTMVPMTSAEVQAHTNPAPTFTQIANNYAAALGIAIDAFAQTWGYDSIYTAATYLSSAIPKFATEAHALITWRDLAWHRAETLLAQVQTGTAVAPTSTAAFVQQVLPPTPSRPTA